MGKINSNKKIIIFIAMLIIIIVATVSVAINIILPNIKYNKAVDLMNSGYGDDACILFEELGDYKDSVNYLKKIQLKNARVGEYITFGKYEQDNDTSNGAEDIEWLVLEIKNDKALVVSRYGLDSKSYHDAWVNVTWETSSLRKWLNSEFIDTAFSEKDKELIPLSDVPAHGNPGYENGNAVNTPPGKLTQDKVFLLSAREAYKYFDSNEERRCKATEYAISKGCSNFSAKGNEWFTRTAGGSQQFVAMVNHVGAVAPGGLNVEKDIATVRPALWINLDF